MARETVYIVQSYIARKGNRLRAASPLPCNSAETARRKGRTACTSELGVVAFSSSDDQAFGDYDDEPTVLFKTGRLAELFEN